MATTPETRSSIRCDVVLIGGGMVGMTFAAAVASAGYRVTVIDRIDPLAQTAAGFDGRVSAIALGSRRVLTTLGLWDAIASQAAPILDIRVTDDQAPVFLHFDHREVGDEPLGHIVENRHIREGLMSRIPSMPGIEILAPATVAAMETDDARATVTLDDGRVIEAGLLVGADGRNSSVRRHAGINVTRWDYGQTAIVATVAHQFDHRGVAEERFLPVGPFAILPMTDDDDGRHRSSLVWTESTDRAPAFVALNDADFDAEIAHRFGDHLGTVTATGPRWTYPLMLSLAESYVAPRLALIGDAAHSIHPIAGQGLNLGIRDAAALAEVLVDGLRLGLDPGDLTMLEEYERWRRFDNVALAAATDIFNRLFSTGFGPLRLARDAGLAVVNRLPPARRFFMREAMGMTGKLPRLVQGDPL